MNKSDQKQTNNVVSNSGMTSAARMKAALSGQIPDRVPFAPTIS